MGRIIAICRRYRYGEALLGCGFALVGAMFAAPDWTAFWSLRSMALFFASYLVVFSIFAFNSWAGLREDAANPRLAVDGLASGWGYAVVTAVSFVGALAVFLLLRPVAIPYALAVFALCGIYSFPRYGAKYMPVAGTLAHVAIGVTQFQQGWALLDDPGARSLLMSLYFGLILSAGHVNHELIDYEADRTAGIMSGAVRFGPRHWIWLHTTISFVALCLIVFLTFGGAFPLPWAFPFMTASLLQLLSAARLCMALPTQRRLLAHRALYRFCYLVAGIIFLAVRISAS